jgi:anti-sigma regulatory factor (Ser/Thr protein kinase)
VAALRLPTASSDPDHLALVLDADPEAAPTARVAARALGRDPQEAADLGLAVSELVGNAVRHGAAGEDAIILLSVLREGDAFVITASNVPADGPRPGGGGLGFEVLRTLGADVELRREPGRTVASCRLPRDVRAIGLAG